MYLMLIGQVTGLSMGLLGHSLLSGSFRASAAYAVPLIALFVLFAAAEAESFIPPQWRKRIASRLIAGQLRRSFCFCLGIGIGIVIYPIEWFICRDIFDEDDRTRTTVAIALALITVAASAYVGWYLLTKYPRIRNDAAP